MKHKKFLLVLSSILTLSTLASCQSCNCNNKTDDDSKKEDEDDSKKEDPIYDEIKTYSGYIDSNLPFSLVDGMDTKTISLLTSNITFSIQSATNISKIDYYKSFKFHINLDLYSDETSFTTSLITQKVLPTIFSDFKYTTILDNVSDFDLYYLGDGMLYATLSSFKDTKPSRSDALSIKNATREIVSVTRMDIKAIVNEIGDKIKNEEYKNFDFKGTLESVLKVLNGVTLDIELMNKIFTSSLLTFTSDGFSYKLKENGVSNLNTFLNDLIINLVNSKDLGITLSEDSKLLDLDSFTFEASTSSIKLNIGIKDKASSLINLNLINDSTSENSIDPSSNLEEEYLYNKSIIDKVDALYLGYTNYQLSDDYKVTFQNLINDVTSLSSNDFKRISNFNNANGYQLLEVKDNNTYGYLKDYNDILSSVDSFKNIINSSFSSDKEKLSVIEIYFDLYYGNNHYSDYLKDNIVSKAKENNDSKYNELIKNIETFFNSYIEKVESEITTLKDNYLKNTEYSLSLTHDFIESLFKVVDHDNVTLSNLKEIESLSEMNDTDKIQYLSYSLYQKFMETSLLSKNDKSTLVEPFKEIINSYLISISKSLKDIDSDLTYINTLSDLLMFNGDDNLEDSMSLLDLLSSTSFKTSIKSEYRSLIDTLLADCDKLANASIDKVIKEENIYKLNHKEKIESKIKELDEVYTYYDEKIVKSNELLSKYSSSLTFITKYNTLKNLLNEELNYFED